MSVERITEQTAPTGCPACSRKIDAFTGFDGVRPKPEDISICFGCGAVLTWQGDMTLTVFQRMDQLSPAEREKVVEMQLHVREIRQP